MKKILTLTVLSTIIITLIFFYRSGSVSVQAETLSANPVRQLINPPTSTPIPTGTPIPHPRNHTPIPTITAKSYIVYHPSTKTILAHHNSNKPLPPASTTKIMTAIVALENYSLTEIATVPVSSTIGAHIGLQHHEKISIENLLYGILLQSGNDAAYTLAYHHSQGVTGFVNAMNNKAKQLGLEETHFVNPHGLHDPLHLSSAEDLIKMTEYALTIPAFAKIVSTENIIVTNQDGSISHQLNNLNELLGTIPGVKGVKTGWTEEAGEALVTYINRDHQSIIIAVLASQNRFEDTKSLIDWTYTYTNWNN